MTLPVIPEGPDREFFIKEVARHLTSLQPLYARTVEQLRATPDDAAQREIIAAFTDELKRFVGEPTESVPLPQERRKPLG